MGQRSRAGQTSCTLFYPGRLRLPLFRGRAVFSRAHFSVGRCGAGSGSSRLARSCCRRRMQKPSRLARHNSMRPKTARPRERMARIVADDEYGVALLAVAHQPKQSLDAFDRAIALLPASTVKPDSLQWAVAFWHRATAYQQLQPVGACGRRSGDGRGYVDQRLSQLPTAMRPWPSISGNCASGYGSSTRMCWSVRASTAKHKDY